MTEFVARNSKSRLILLLLGNVCMITLALIILGFVEDPTGVLTETTDSFRRGENTAKVASWIMIPVLGVGGLLTIKMLFDSHIQVRINASGIYYKPWSDVTIPWAEIQSIRFDEEDRQKTIILDLENPDRYRATTLMGKIFGGITITLAGTDGRFESAVEAINEFTEPDDELYESEEWPDSETIT